MRRWGPLLSDGYRCPYRLAAAAGTEGTPLSYSESDVAGDSSEEDRER